jgi:RNA polymerase sigma-70 factor (ECF subfamily)
MSIEEYNQCVDLFSDNVYRFILKNIKDTEKARDIVQETYEKLWVKADSVNYERAKSYLFSAAYHTMIDMIRKDSRQVLVEEYHPSSHSHTEQYTDLNEVLHEALSKLPESQRSVIMLRDYEGYSYYEIAEITGLSEAQVKVYIYRGRMFLKNYIGKLETIL